MSFIFRTTPKQAPSFADRTRSQLASLPALPGRSASDKRKLDDRCLALIVETQRKEEVAARARKLRRLEAKVADLEIGSPERRELVAQLDRLEGRAHLHEPEFTDEEEEVEDHVPMRRMTQKKQNPDTYRAHDGRELVVHAVEAFEEPWTIVRPDNVVEDAAARIVGRREVNRLVRAGDAGQRVVAEIALEGRART